MDLPFMTTIGVGFLLPLVRVSSIHWVSLSVTQFPTRSRSRKSETSDTGTGG